MTRPLHTNPEESAREAGLSRRIAARLGALARSNLYISDVVLEVLGEPGAKPLETLLLLPSLPDKAASLNADDLPLLVQLVADPEGFLTANPLKVIRQGQHACLALADESDELDELAELNTSAATVEPSGPAAGSGALTLRADPNRPNPLTRFVDPSVSFNPESLGEIKLTLLTSTHADQKIEALRRIWLSPVPSAEKAQLLLIALRDRNADLRAEAARGLATFGVNSRLADNLSRACTGKESARVVALSNLRQLASELSGEELALAFSVTCELLDSGESDHMNAAIIDAIRQLAGEMKELPADSAGRLMYRIHDTLHVQRAVLLPALRRLLATLGEVSPSTIATLLLEGVRETSLAHLRNFLLSVLPVIDHPKARSKECAQLLIRAMLDSSELDPSYANLSSGLNRLGSHALEPLRQVFENASTSQQLRLLPVLSEFLNATTDRNLIDSITSALIEAFETGTKSFRTAFYESSFLRRWPPQGTLARRAARVMLEDIHEHELESFREVVTGTILHLGGDVFPEALAIIGTGTRSLTLNAACDLLGQVTLRWPEHDQVSAGVTAALDRLRELFADENFPDRGTLLRTIGCLASHRNCPSDVVLGLVGWLDDDLIGRSSLTYDAVEALGWIASGDSIDETTRMEVSHRLLEFIKRDLPKIRGRVREEDGGLTLEVGSEASAYTDLIPRLVTVFSRLLARPNLQIALWNHITDTLCGIFERVATFRVIWAPGSAVMLAQSLAEACNHPHATTSLRERIAELVLLKDTVTQMLILALHVCSAGDGPRMAALAQTALQAALATLSHSEDLDPSEQRELLSALVTLLKRQQIGPSESTDRQARRAILDAVYDGLRRRLPSMIALLRSVAESEQVVNVDRDEIRRQISRWERSVQS